MLQKAVTIVPKHYCGGPGSNQNFLIAWEDGLRTFEPLKTIADNPAVCAVYTERAKLLDTDGWKQFRRLAKRPKVLDRQLN
jgi:hypothetical protein